MIAIIGHIDVDPSVRGELVASTASTQVATAANEPGCIVYTIAADPTNDSRIRIVELWESREALEHHFNHPNIAAIMETLQTQPWLDQSVMKYAIDAADDVLGPDGVPTATFSSAE